MAERYIILGATNNGDGTATNEAASAGAAGAWNQQSILTGTAPAYGSLSAGDTVHIRSKTGNGADANIAISHTGVTLGNAAGTAAAPIKWVLDNGVKWSGVDGTMTWTGSNAAHQVQARTFNYLYSLTRGALAFRNTAVASNFILVAAAASGVFYARGLFLDCSGSGANYQCASLNQPNCSWLLEDCLFKGTPGNTTAAVVAASGGGSSLTIVNPTIELTHTSSKVFGDVPASSTVRVLGGRLHGAGAATGTYLLGGSGALGGFEAVGFQYPRAVGAVAAELQAAWPAPIRVTGADGGAGSIVRERWGEASSRSDGFYPVLNAVLPDSDSSGWSWLVRPAPTSLAAIDADPWRVTVGKFYTDAPDAKTLTIELLASNDWAGGEIDTSMLWVSVSYIDDATGETRHISTRNVASGTALTTSTAAWSTTTYGATAFGKRKIEVTTPTDIKQDTMIWVTVMGAQRASSAGKFFFICPDVQAS